jgi:DNA-directed RNA polymerase subunit RPC12/RpoP
MPRTRIACPNCRQPVEANINQLFDVGVDPTLKQIVLSGAINHIQCPHCGYQGGGDTGIALL